MIIWGSRGRTFTEQKGRFFCPSCDSEKNYEHKKVEKWFTLYFLPIFPTKKLGEYIECGSCESTFQMKVLNYNQENKPSNFHSEFSIAALNIMSKIALADNTIEKSEILEY